MKNETQFMIRVERAFVDRVRKQSERFGMTLSSYMRLAIIQKLEVDEKNDQKFIDEKKAQVADIAKTFGVPESRVSSPKTKAKTKKGKK